MFLPVTLVFGGDLTLADLIAERFYDSGSAVILVGSDGEKLANTHRKINKSDWIKISKQNCRNAKNGKKAAEQTIDELFGVSQIIAIAEWANENNCSESEDLPIMLRNMLSDVLDETLAAASYVGTGCPIVLLVNFPGAGSSDIELLKENVGRWLCNEREHGRLRKTPSAADFHLLVVLDEDLRSTPNKIVDAVFGICTLNKGGNVS